LHSVCPYEIEQVRIREEEEENYVIEYDEYEEIEFEYEDDRNEDEYDPNHDFMPKLPPQRKPAPTRPPRITKPQTTTVYRPPNQVKSESRVINREPGEVDPDIPSFFLQKEVLLVSAGLVFVIGFALAVGLVSCAKKRQERQAEADRVRRENDRRARREQRNGNVGGQGSNEIMAGIIPTIETEIQIIIAKIKTPSAKRRQITLKCTQTTPTTIIQPLPLQLQLLILLMNNYQSTRQKIQIFLIRICLEVIT